MKILPNGFFSDDYSSKDLKHGLRPSARMPRNSKFLTECKGAVGQDGVLRTLDTLALTAALTGAGITTADFPFPQLFILERHVLVANRTSIYEWNGTTGALFLAIGSLTTGGKWTLASSHNFIYMSNGVVSVVRNAESQVWALNTTAPKGTVCMFNGQILVGNPK